MKAKKTSSTPDGSRNLIGGTRRATPPDAAAPSGPVDTYVAPGTTDPSLAGGETAKTDPTPTSDPAKTKTKTSRRSHHDPDDALRRSRTGGFWVALVALAVLLVLLIIFIAQNTRRTTVTFLFWEGDTPVAVALLIAAVAGLLIAGAVGTLRILQLRHRVKLERKRG